MKFKMQNSNYSREMQKKINSRASIRKSGLAAINTKKRITLTPKVSKSTSFNGGKSQFLPKFIPTVYSPPSKNLTPLDNELIRKEYTLKTLKILNTLFPKSCDCPKSSKEPKLNFLKLKGKESIARCSYCHKQISITSKTPFENIKLPLAFISYIIQDQILQYPKVMTS